MLKNISSKLLCCITKSDLITGKTLGSCKVIAESTEINSFLAETGNKS